MISSSFCVCAFNCFSTHFSIWDNSGERLEFLSLFSANLYKKDREKIHGCQVSLLSPPCLSPAIVGDIVFVDEAGSISLIIDGDAIVFNGRKGFS